jgi:hypothetical protein
VALPADGRCLVTDACLGVPGLPQSATGQTTLFTGVNAAELIGRHLQGYPTRQLKELISTQSLFVRLKKLGNRVTFANTYTPRFFEERPRWVSVTTVMCETAGVELGGLEKLIESKGLFMDFSNAILHRKDREIPLRSPRQAASILAGLSRECDLCLYEYFLTDLVGHRGSLDDAVSLLKTLDQFLRILLDSIDLERTSLIIASDHGNIEDMSVTTHNVNPVPTLVWGDLKSHFESPGDGFNLTKITPVLESYFRS